MAFRLPPPIGRVPGPVPGPAPPARNMSTSPTSTSPSPSGSGSSYSAGGSGSFAPPAAAFRLPTPPAGRVALSPTSNNNNNTTPTPTYKSPSPPPSFGSKPSPPMSNRGGAVPPSSFAPSLSSSSSAFASGPSSSPSIGVKSLNRVPGPPPSTASPSPPLPNKSIAPPLSSSSSSSSSWNKPAFGVTPPSPPPTSTSISPSSSSSSSSFSSSSSNPPKPPPAVSPRSTFGSIKPLPTPPTSTGTSNVPGPAPPAPSSARSVPVPAPPPALTPTSSKFSVPLSAPPAPPAAPAAAAAPAATSSTSSSADSNGYGYDENGYGYGYGNDQSDGSYAAGYDTAGYDANGYAAGGYDANGYTADGTTGGTGTGTGTGYDTNVGYDASSGYDASNGGYAVNTGYDANAGYDANGGYGAYDASYTNDGTYDASGTSAGDASLYQENSDASYDASSYHDESQYSNGMETSVSSAATGTGTGTVTGPPKPPPALRINSGGFSALSLSSASPSSAPATPISPTARASPSSTTSATGSSTGRPSIVRQPTLSPRKSYSAMEQPPDFTSMDAFQVCEAFVESEGRYVEGLKQLEKMLSDHKLVKTMCTMTETELTAINNSLAQIHHFHAGLHADLLSAQRDGTLYDVVGKIMVKRMPFFKLYTTYVKMHRETSKSYKRDKETNKLAPLRDLMMAPVSRLANYMIYLGTILEKSDPSSPAVADLEMATMATQKVTDEIAVALRDDAGRKLVATIQQKIFKDSVELISPHRFAIKQSKVMMLKDSTAFSKKTGFDKIRIVLFNDCFLYGTLGGKLMSPKVVAVMQLIGMDIEDMKDAMGASQLPDGAASVCFRVKTRSHKPLIIRANSPEEKVMWIHLLREIISKANETEQASLGNHVSAEEFECKIMKKKYLKRAMTLKPDKSRPSISNSPAPYAAATLKPSNIPAAPQAPVMTAPAAPPLAPPMSFADTAAEVAPAAAAQWEQLWDETYQCYYYSNIETGETTWEQPSGWVDPNAPVVGDSAPPAPDALVEGFGAPAAPAPPTPASPSGGDLLSAIRGGANLKSASARAPGKALPSEPVKPSLADALKNSLAQYRHAVQNDEDDFDNDDNDDWD